MNLKYVKEPFLNTLNQSVEQSLKLYGQSDSWLESHGMASTGIGSTGLEVKLLRQLELPTGKQGSSLKDLENAKLVYSDLDFLTPQQAQDHRLWVFLTHVQYWNYMQVRWEPSKASIIKRRYLFEGGNKDALIRNGISRLWWFGYLTYDAQRTNPFELTETLLKNQDVQQALLERNFGRNRQLLHVTLDYIRQNVAKFNSGGGMTKNVQRLGVNINMLGGVALLDAMDKTEMSNMVAVAAGH